jgi:hypothetical protein
MPRKFSERELLGRQKSYERRIQKAYDDARRLDSGKRENERVGMLPDLRNDVNQMYFDRLRKVRR